MKKTIHIMAGIALSFFSVTAFAQQTWDSNKNPTVEAITSKYSDKYIAARPAVTTNDIFPVLGNYESTNTAATSVTITLDQENKGVVWIEGLPQGKIKAMLRKSPAVYKIPEQENADGKKIAEGTLIFDKETNTLNIAIGKEYNSADPAAIFAVADPEKQEAVSKTTAKTKSKKPAQPKTWLYTATKINVETVSN